MKTGWTLEYIRALPIKDYESFYTMTELHEAITLRAKGEQFKKGIQL
jgi:hypothetical protein